MLSHKSILELPQKNNTKAEFEFEFEIIKDGEKYKQIIKDLEQLPACSPCVEVTLLTGVYI